MIDNKFMSASIEDLIRNPGKYGAPTFEEFSKNPDKYRKSEEAMLTTAEKGSKTIKGITKHIYYVDGIKCESVEHAQRIMSTMGLRQDDLQLAINLEDLGNHKIQAHVYFKRKPNLILPEGM